MISLKRAKKESRPRDLRRKRWILRLGRVSFHLTRGEVRDLAKLAERAARS